MLVTTSFFGISECQMIGQSVSVGANSLETDTVMLAIQGSAALTNALKIMKNENLCAALHGTEAFLKAKQLYGEVRSQSC